MFDSIKSGVKKIYNKGKKAVSNIGKKIFGGSSGSSTHKSSSGSSHGGSSGSFGTTHGGSSGSYGRSSYVSRSPRYSGPAARSYGANTVSSQSRSGASRLSAGMNRGSGNGSTSDNSALWPHNTRRGSRSETTHNTNSGSFAERNPHALSTDAKKNQEEVAGNIKRFGAGVGKRYAGSQVYGLKDNIQDAYKAFLKTLPGGGAVSAGTTTLKYLYDNTAGKANKDISLKNLDSVVDRNLKKYGGKLQESGEKDMEKLRENSSAPGKWGIDLAAGAAELGLDVALTRGRGTMAAMYNRAYGSAKKTAIDEGATEDQAKLYGNIAGGIEVGTEKISSVAAPLRKLYGKGATDELTDRVIDKIVSKATSKAGKNIAYHGAKTVASAIGEGLEEMVSEGLDPVVANAIYAKAVGNPHSTSSKDILYAGSIGAALGGVLGGGGQVVEYNRGKKVLSAAENNMFGEGGIKSLINEAKTADEDTGDNVKAQAYGELVNTGQGIVAGQANELYSSVQSQRARDDQRYGISMRASDNMIRKNGYVPVVSVDSEGNAKIADNTRITYEKYSAFNEEVIKGEMQLPETRSKEIAAAVSELQTGIADTSTVNMFTTANPEARTAYERITGEKLPDTNQGTRAYLYEKLAENRVESARAETEYFKDTMKGLIQQDVTPTYDTAGQEAFSKGMENVNVGSGNDVSNYIVSFEHFYEAGRTGLDYSDVAKTGNPAYDSVSSEIKKSAYEAGVRDRADVKDNVKGMQIKIGQTLKESRSNGKNKARRGKVISELSKEGKKKVSASTQAVYRTLARAFNLEIHLVEDIAGTSANGFYKDGVMYLNINADRPLSYVFSHEITHHMQQYAPEQYEMFKQLVREKWFQQGGIEDAVSQKIIQYRGNGVELTREEALDEILADSTYEIIQSEEFIDELCRENRSLAQSVLDAVRNVIDKLRAMIAEGQGFTPKHNEALLSELDILKDAAKLWTDGLMKAVENRAAVGVNETSDVRYSIEQDSTGKDVVVVQEDIFKGSEGEKRKKVVTEYLKSHIGDMFTIIENGKRVYLGKDLPNEYNHSKTTERLGKEKRFAKQKATPGIGEMVEIATNERWESPVHKEKHKVDAMYGFYKYDTRFAVRDRSGDYEVYDAELVIRHDADRKLYLYDIQGIKKDTAKVRFPLEKSQPDLLSEESKATTNGTSINSISETEGNDKTRFSMKEPVEETKELIALHNIGPDSLKKTLKLGGFPMPSIAITKDSIGHINFGEISLLFSKDTIDPARKENKVYAADAWTPMFPPVEYELDSQAAHRRANDVGSLTFFNPTKLAETNLQNVIDKGSDKDAEEQLFERFKDDYGLKNMYLAETSEPVKMAKTEKEKYSPERAAELQEYIDTLGIDTIKKIKENNDFNSEDFAKAKEICAKLRGKDVSSVKAFYVKVDLSAALTYFENGNTEVVEDEDATKKLIDEKVNQEDYEKWLMDLFDGIVTNKGLWNGEDPYTSSGDRKAFSKIHMPVTADNIVRAMLMQSDDVRNSSNLFLGTRTVRAVAAEDFKSIDGIRKASGKLKNIDTEEYDAVKEELDERLNVIMHEILNGTNKSGNEFMSMDSIGRCIEDACRKPTAANFKKVLGEYGWEISGRQAEALHEVVSDIADMPVNMFEAKPQRVVGFDEIKTAVVPDSIDAELKSEMEAVGMEIDEYEAGNEADRLAKINAAADLKGVKFSLNENNFEKSQEAEGSQKDSEGRFSVPDYSKKEYNRYGWAVANELLSREEMAVFQKQVGDKARGDLYKIREGLHIIPTGEKGLRNVLVYTDGNFERPSIAKIIRINLEDGTEIEAVTEDVYDEEYKNTGEPVRAYKEKGVLDSFEAGDYDYTEWSRNRRSTANRTIFEDSTGERDGRGSDRESQTDSEEIKYSLPDESDVLDYINESEGEFYDVPPMRYYEIRQKQVKMQTYEELQKLCEKLKADKKLTHGKVLDKSSVTEQMNDLVRCLMTYSESYSLRGNPRKVKSELVKFAADKASDIFRAIKNEDYTTAMNTAYLAASDIVESLDFVDDANFYEYKELRDYLRTTRMFVSEEDMNSIPDFTEFKRDQFGRLRIVKENGISVDQVYSELCEMYPELFDTEITNPADQLMKIADVRENLEPYDMMLAAEETEQLKKQTAQDLMEISALGKPWKSWADKKKEDYDARLKLVKTRHQEAVREIRRKERARADERIAAEKEKAKQKLQQEKQRSSEKLQEEKQKSREKLRQEKVRSQEKIQAEKDKAREKEAKRKTLRERAKSFGRIKKNYDWLCERLVKPTDDKHIPHEFTEAVADLLMCFDLQTERSKQLQEKRGYKAQKTIKADELKKRISRVKERFEKLAPEDDTGVFEYDGYVFELMDSLEQKLDGKESIDTLSNEDLAAVDILLKSVVHNINNYNKFFNENIKEGIDEIGKGVIESADAKIKARGKNKVERGGTAGDLLNESNVTSRDLFERMGGGMETMYMELRSGFDKHIDNITELREFFEDLFKGYHNKKKPGSKIQRWRNQKGLKTVRLESGEEIKISVAQIMSLYCSAKREQALGHILEGGIVLTEVKSAGKFREAVRGKRGLPGTSTKVTYNDVQNIVSQLTSEQRSMADKLQGFLNGRAAQWGNEASMKMYGYEKFTEKDYFPIKSSRTWLATNAETVDPKEKIRNFGFTKNTVQGANNTIVIDDIFTVFADHVNKMSQYNALAPAIADFMKVYNYTDKSAGGLTVKGKISDAWGSRYQRYIERFMADLQSNFDMKTEGIGRFMAKSLANYKRAAIGFNLRVAVQQPTAIARAFLLINPVYFVSKNHTPSVLKKMMRKDTEYKDMIDHCPIARWKSWGNTQVDMARDIDAIMMNEEWTRADLISMEIYGTLDNYTWSKIWGAVRAETKAKHKDVEVNSEEFYRICNERASEIFDKTQVVDSVFHRSQAMRNTDAMSKTLTSFMAEPTRTYNMMKSAYGDAVECWHNKHKVNAAGKFIGATNVFLINAAAVSAAAAVADALRGKQPGDDDDDDKEGFDLWLANAIANFWDNANPLSMIPIVKDIWSFKDGWGSSNMGLEGFAQVMESGQAILDKIGGGSDKDWNELMRDFAEGMGYVTGRPVKNILREYDVIQTKLMSAFAAEAGGEDTVSKGKEWINSTLDKLSGKTGKSDENEKGGSGSDRGIVDKLVGKMDIEDGSTLDNVLNKVGLNLTDEERAAREKKKMLSDVESQISGLTGDEKNEKLWKVVTKNYTNYVNDGNIDELKRMRSTLKEFDGDVDKFDKSVLSKIQTAYKKNIGEKGDPDKLQIYRDYLKDRGYTDGKISQEIIAKSDTAKEYQKALCLNDEEAAGKYLSELSLAGLTYESYSLLFDNRSKAIKGADYSSGEFAFPVSGEITSGFGGRQSPGGIGSTDHKGIDVGVVTGTSVAAADGGKVVMADWNGGYGNCVIIDHGNGRQTLYGHLEGYTVQAGDVVGKGQEIGKSGSTGNSTGPHLHFGVKEGGRFVDPMSYFR